MQFTKQTLTDHIVCRSSENMAELLSHALTGNSKRLPAEMCCYIKALSIKKWLIWAFVGGCLMYNFGLIKAFVKDIHFSEMLFPQMN